MCNEPFLHEQEDDNNMRRREEKLTGGQSHEKAESRTEWVVMKARNKCTTYRLRALLGSLKITCTQQVYIAILLRL